MLPHFRHLLTFFILAVIQLTHAIPDSNFSPDNSPIQINLDPPAKSDPAPTSRPEPTRRLFTVAAFRSPYPPGTPGQISGTVMRAEGGILWLDPQNPLPETGCEESSKQGDCPPGNETVLWVDRDGKAWLDSEDPQQIYLDTKTGVLSYLSPATNPKYAFQPGAISTNFMHFGEGTVISVPSRQPGYWNAGPGSFLFTGYQFNPTWFACPRPDGRGLQVMRLVEGKQDWGTCMGGLQMIALDYSGPSPAAGIYL